MRIVVVGGGMQGRVIAGNLSNRSEKPDVVVVDINEPPRLPAGVRFQNADVLQSSHLSGIADGADALVLAVPSSIAHQALSNLIKTGKPITDVSFTPDPPLDLDSAAKGSGSVCVVDCGVAPGLSHVLIGSAHKELGGLDSARIFVGGLPQEAPATFKHAVFFNPHDLMSEYVRPARARTGGKNIAPNPLHAEIEEFVDPELGQLEAFLSDGLRTLLTSYPDISEMSELTLRWPGHLDSMKVLTEMGLLHDHQASHAIAVSLANTYPEESYPDVLLMVVEARKGDQVRGWRLIDRRTDGRSAMSRTTGFTAAAITMLLARKQFTDPGVHPPEHLGQNVALAREIVGDLKAHGINVCENLPAVKQG